MTFNLTVNESCGTPPDTAAATKQVRVFYEGPPDGGHVSGPFTPTQAATAATAALAKSGVLRAVIEDAE